MESFERFQQSISWKVLFAAEDQNPDYIKSKLYLKTKRIAPLPPLSIDRRLCKVEMEIRKLFNNALKRNVRSNFTPYQRKLFKRLRGMSSIIFANADKNLGPVAVSLLRYIRDGLNHLLDTSTYAVISKAEAVQEDLQLREDIISWLNEWHELIHPVHRAYLRKKLKETEEDPFGYFYLLYKLHKTPIKTRPVCSDCSSTCHALGQWVNEMLQPIAQAQAAYFKDTFALKNILDKITLDGNKRYGLCTFDAVSMYTKINPGECIKRLSKLLRDPETQRRFSYPTEALIEAITIILENNRMNFGDIIVRQLVGIAMGMAPAPPIANLFCATYEKDHVLTFIEVFLLLYLRFIDDGFAIWIYHDDPVVDAANWNLFRETVNDSGLEWEFTERLDRLDFMDLTIEIVGNKIETNLYEKPLALHLYIPPKSCHPTSCVGSLISGMVLRIYRLCSRTDDIKYWLCQFLHCLLDRGYQLDKISPVFTQAVANAEHFISRSDTYHQLRRSKKKLAASRRVAFHLQYHPNDPKSSTLQKLMRDHLFSPKGQPPLNQCTNRDGDLVPIDGMVIAYSTALNIGNLLSYRKICNRPGPKVSSFI